MTQTTFTKLSWAAFGLLNGLTIIAWAADKDWQIGSLNAYGWFPLFGLIAWVTMALHYVLGTIRIRNSSLKRPTHFKEITGYVVLLALLLHPFILALKQQSIGAGVPPQSFVEFVGENLRLAVMLGSLSLTLFLAFEVLERFKKRPFVHRNWLFVSISQSLAMMAIWIHAWRLGDIVREGWFSVIWIGLGLMLIPCFYVIHRFDIDQQKNQS